MLSEPGGKQMFCASQTFTTCFVNTGMVSGLIFSKWLCRDLWRHRLQLNRLMIILPRVRRSRRTMHPRVGKINPLYASGLLLSLSASCRSGRIVIWWRALCERRLDEHRNGSSCCDEDLPSAVMLRMLGFWVFLRLQVQPP